jgi:phage FluMu protein Com
MPNTDCLEGIRCPGCKQEDELMIELLVSVRITDDGTEDQGGDYEWDDNSPCSCPKCKFLGTIKDFQVESQPKPGAS